MELKRASTLVEAVWGSFGDVRNQFGVGEHFYSQDVQGYGYDPEKAKALLAEGQTDSGGTWTPSAWER